MLWLLSMVVEAVRKAAKQEPKSSVQNVFWPVAGAFDFPLFEMSTSSTEYRLEALLAPLLGVKGRVLVGDKYSCIDDDEPCLPGICIGGCLCICCACFWSSNSFHALLCFSRGYRGTLAPVLGVSKPRALRDRGWKPSEATPSEMLGAIGGRESGLGRRGMKCLWSMGDKGGLSNWDIVNDLRELIRD